MKSTELLVFDDAEKMRRKIMKTITAKEFDKKFDNGEDITEYLDFSTAVRLKGCQKTENRNKKSQC